MATWRIFIAGSGGQGILLMGKLLAYAAMEEGKEVTFLPSYGAEMRGGTANCGVVISDRPIGSPVVNEAEIVVVMNEPSLKKFEANVLPDKHLFINATLVPDKTERTDIRAYYVNANELAERLGIAKAANMVMLGAVVRATNAVLEENVQKAIEKEFSGKKAKLKDTNLSAFMAWNP